MKNELLLNITGPDDTIHEVIGNALKCFHGELEHYIEHNDDSCVLEYANEQSLACMLVNGLIRQDSDKKISALQEYGCGFEAGSYGRPDIFLRIGDVAFYIECKYDRTKNLRGDHWDIKGWLDWDTKEIYSQVINYCNSEKRNNSYTGGCYVITMVFKLINDKDNSHQKKIQDNTHNILESIGDRDWYYSYAITGDCNEDKLGLEIYGTFKKIEGDIH